MTTAEQLVWINANMTGSPKISPETMRNFWFMMRDSYAHVDGPLPNYTEQIIQADLDGNLEIVITHNLGTIVPEVVLYNETDNIIYDEYFQLTVIDEDSFRLTFSDDIPATDNGCYKLAAFYITAEVPVRYVEVFSSDFDAWTEGEPDNFTVTKTYAWGIWSNPTVENDNDRAKLTMDSFGKCVLSPNVELDLYRTYRVTIKLDEGNLQITIGSNSYSLVSPGEYTFLLPAADTALKFNQGSATVAIVDSITIEEELS